MEVGIVLSRCVTSSFRSKIVNVWQTAHSLLASTNTNSSDYETVPIRTVTDLLFTGNSNKSNWFICFVSGKRTTRTSHTERLHPFVSCRFGEYQIIPIYKYISFYVCDKRPKSPSIKRSPKKNVCSKIFALFVRYVYDFDGIRANVT